MPRIGEKQKVASQGGELSFAGMPYPHGDSAIPRDSFRLIGSPGDVNGPDHRRDNAVHQYRTRKNNWQFSLKELERVVSKTEDWTTYYWIAKIAYDHNIIEKAMPAARKSLELAKKKDEKEKSQNLIDAMERSFSPVRLSQNEKQVKEGTRGYVTLDATKPFIELKKKDLFAEIKARLEKRKIELPATIYLPFGEYAANGIPFAINKGGEATAGNLMLLYSSESEETWNMGWLGVAAGVIAVGALSLAGLFASPEQEVKEVIIPNQNQNKGR